MGWAGALAPIYWLLGARVVLASNASLSRRCWCVVPLRPLPSSRSPCRHVVVAPMRSRCHCAFSRQSPPVRASCRPALLVGHVGRPWLCGLVGRVVGVVVAVPGGVVVVRTRLVVARASLAANGRLRAPALSAAWALISHVSSQWSKQCQYSDSSPPPAHMASSHPSGAR